MMEGIDAVIVPGGFGSRGVEGKIQVIRRCRENNIPLLGICYGMQLAVVEYARNVCGIGKANTTEVLADNASGVTVEDPVVCILPEQLEVVQKGATMRLGGHDVYLKKGSLAAEIYGKEVIRERFRHRYEVNPDYVATLSKGGGLVFSGYTKDKKIMQVMELPGHPYFVGAQFHPELTSRLEAPAPMFLRLIETALKLKTKTN
jgi:CTP synthase